MNEMCTDVDEFDAVSGDGVESSGSILEHLVLVDGAQYVAQFPPLQDLDEGDQPYAVA